MSVKGIDLAGATLGGSVCLISGAMGYCALKNPIDPRDGAPVLTDGPRRTIFLAFAGMVFSAGLFLIENSRTSKN